MNLYVLNNSNAKYAVVAGKVKSIRKGTGKAEGKVVNVTLTGTEWDKEAKDNKPTYIDIAFWNSDDGKQLATRIEKAGIREGEYIAALIFPPTDNKATGVDFTRSGHYWTIPQQDKKDLTVFVGTVASLDSYNDGNLTKVSVPVSFKDETTWYKINFWNNEEQALADRAKACLAPKEGAEGEKQTYVKAVIVCGEKLTNEERPDDPPSFTGFRFELFPQQK